MDIPAKAARPKIDDGTSMDVADCRTMDDVRREIDRLDRKLVALLATRQGFIEAAARIKGERRAVRDETRIGEVMARVKEESARRGLSLDIAEAVWRALIDASIAYELEEFDRRHR